MTATIPFCPFDWSPLHGDSDQTPAVALLAGRDPISLGEWSVRAQVRDRQGRLVHAFVPDVGIVTGEAEVRFADRPDDPAVLTSWVRLRLRPSDFADGGIPRKLRGSFDLEVSRGQTTRTVMGGLFEVAEDVTHD